METGVNPWAPLLDSDAGLLRESRAAGRKAEFVSFLAGSARGSGSSEVLCRWLVARALPSGAELLSVSALVGVP